MLNDVLIPLDQDLLLLLNGSRSVYFDRLIDQLTTASTWIPLYVALLLMVVKNNASFRQVVFIIVCATLCVLLAGTVDDMFVKPMVARLRPTHDPTIGILVDVVDGYRGGKYGFFSAHAANTFSLAVFVSLLVRSRLMTVSLVAWSLVNCYTRMYLGLHYPSDILCGLLWGGLSALVSYMLYLRIFLRLSPVNNYVSSHYTCTGYSYNDIDNVMLVLMLTLAYTLLRAVYMVF